MQWHWSGWFYSEKFLHRLFLCLSEGYRTRCWVFKPRWLLTGPELMQALFGTHWKQKFSLLPRTKASQATSEAALGRLCLLGSQRKWEITQNTEECPQNSPNPPGPTGHVWPHRDSSGQVRASPIKGLIWFAFFQAVEIKSSWRCVCFSVYVISVYLHSSLLLFPSWVWEWAALLGKTNDAFHQSMPLCLNQMSWSLLPSLRRKEGRRKGGRIYWEPCVLEIVHA